MLTQREESYHHIQAVSLPRVPPAAADQEHGVKVVLCLREAFCARV